MIYKIADYQRDVLGAAVRMRMGRVTVADCRQFRELLDAGEHYPATSPEFEAVRAAGEAFLAACDEARGLRAVTIDPPEPAEARLGEAIAAYCRQFDSAEAAADFAKEGRPG